MTTQTNTTTNASAATTAQHTPGPWKFHLGRGTNPRWHVQTSGGYQIASTPERSLYGPENEGYEAMPD